MKMCEYANNLFDMFLLVSITDKNREIVYDFYETLKYDKPTPLYVSTRSGLFSMFFPRMNGDFNYIDLNTIQKEITFIKAKFEKANEKYLEFDIFFGD
jgi:nicotinic acid phosphoribosyltransferase